MTERPSAGSAGATSGELGHGAAKAFVCAEGDGRGHREAGAPALGPAKDHGQLAATDRGIGLKGREVRHVEPPAALARKALEPRHEGLAPSRLRSQLLLREVGLGAQVQKGRHDPALGLEGLPGGPKFRIVQLVCDNDLKGGFLRAVGVRHRQPALASPSIRNAIAQLTQKSKLVH